MQNTLLAPKAVTEFKEGDVLALSEAKDEPAWMKQRRINALQVFRDTPRPTTKEEAWRRTDIRRVKLDKVAPAMGGARLEDLPSRLTEMINTNEQAGLLLHANGGLVHAALDKELAQ